jgi:ABC-type sugar transport system ATPase subunit
MSSDTPAVSMKDIEKRYGEIVALDGVDLTLRKGEILALVGDNGAGKSTLINCLAGVHSPTSGRIEVDGRKVTIDSPRESKQLGIETTFQDLALASNLTVAQNIFLGREEMKGPDLLFGLLDKQSMNERTRELLEDLNIDVEPDALVGDLSGGQRQLVAISRMLLTDPQVVVMDEPTSALSVEGADRVLDLIERLRDQGISVLLISHNLENVIQIADRVQVLYQGLDAGTVDGATTTRDEIVGRMVSGHPDRKDARQPA